MPDTTTNEGLTREEARKLNGPKVDEAKRERIKTLQQKRDHNGGLANVTDPDEQKAIQKAHTELNILSEREAEIQNAKQAESDLDDMEKKLNTPAPDSPPPPGGGSGKEKQQGPSSVTKAFVNSDAYKAYKERNQLDVPTEVGLSLVAPRLAKLEKQGRIAPKMKDSLGTDDTLTNVDREFPPESTRIGVVVEELFQQPNVADLFPQATINQNSIPYMEETVVDTAAAETAEGASYPEAAIEFVETTDPIRKIPVSMPVTEEILEDEDLIRGHIESRLPFFIQLREDAQLLNGNGTDPNLTGILNLSGTNSASFATDDTAQTKIETLFSAGMRVMEEFLQPDNILLGLGLWEELRLAKDGNNNYLIAPVTETATPRMFGWPITTNQNMPNEPTSTGVTNDVAVVGAFGQSGQVWRRRQISLQVSESHSTFFTEGKLMFRATTRVGISYYRPAGMTVVDATAP